MFINFFYELKIGVGLCNRVDDLDGGLQQGFDSASGFYYLAGGIGEK